jgi:hypothetical protein
MKWLTKNLNEWLITILVFFGIVFSFEFFTGGTNFPPSKIHYLFNTKPTSFLLSQESLNAIAMFRGEAPEDFSFNQDSLSVLFNVILYFLIGPFLFYLGFKNEKEGKLKPWYWYIGAVICIGSLAIVPSKVIDIRVFENVKDSAEKSRVHDKMRQELFEVGFEIMEYEIFQEGINPDFTIEKLGFKELQFNYEVVDVDGDTLLTIKALGPEHVEYTPSLEINLNDFRKVQLRND